MTSPWQNKKRFPPIKEPTPGDVGRFAIHMPPLEFADQLVQWCGDDTDIGEVARWFETVALRLRALREKM